MQLAMTCSPIHPAWGQRLESLPSDGQRKHRVVPRTRVQSDFRTRVSHVMLICSALSLIP
jgi:hypothetical protein